MFGSTQDDEVDLATKEELRGGMTRGQKVTVEGLMLEFDLLKQQFENNAEQLTKVIGLVMTLQGRIEAINEARVRELNIRVNHGPTEHGTNDQPSDERDNDTAE
jgi:hypothetical protein